MKDSKTRVQGTPYTLDGVVPLRQAFPLGMQHVLVMLVGNVTAPLIICGFCGIQAGSDLLIIILQNAMLIAGLTTLLQLYPVWKFGGGLPMVLGCAAGYIGMNISIAALVGGGQAAYSTILGATLLGGLVEIVVAIFYQKIKKFFPPLVTGTVLTAVGISLVPVAMNSFAGGSGVADYGSAQNLMLGFIVIVISLCFDRFGKGMWKSCGVLIALAVGYIVATIMTFTMDTTFVTAAGETVTASWAMDWSSVANASWIALPKLMPVPLKFDIRAILPICLIYVSMTIETMAGVNALGEIGLGRKVTDKEMVGTLFCDAVGSSGAAVLGVLPNTAYSSNVGLVNMTKVVNRMTVAVGAVFLILCGFLPKLSAVISIMPSAVLGGASVLMFGQILSAGFSLVAKGGFTSRSNVIVATAIGLGYGIGSDTLATAGLPTFLQLIIGGSGIIPCAILAVLLNAILPMAQEDKDLAAALEAENSAAMKAAAAETAARANK